MSGGVRSYCIRWTRTAPRSTSRRATLPRTRDSRPRSLPEVSSERNGPFDELPDRFVVKPTHGSGWVRFVADKSTLDRAALVATCADWLERSYYRESREVVYRHIAPRILIEEFIDDGHGATPHDYKLFVFGGSVEMIQTDMNRFGGHRQLMYSPAWKKLDVRYVDDDAQILGREWDFIRVDFYDTRDRLYFGEITLTPNEGCVRFRPQEFDVYLGSLWKSRGRTD